MLKNAINDVFSIAEDKGENTHENDYIGDDGFYHCSICHKRTQTEVQMPWDSKPKKVNCRCDCYFKEKDQLKKQIEQDEIEKRKRTCFNKTKKAMQDWTFENDDNRNKKLSTAMRKYVDNFNTFKKDGKGLILFGPCGTGKTFYSACVANALIDRGYRVLMTNFATLTNELAGMFEGKQKYIDSLNNYDLLIIDDLGAERNSSFMKEQIFNIVDSRYLSGLPFIITTNLASKELQCPDDIGNGRIYDRILERCVPIEVKGNSRRREHLKNTIDDMKGILGLND